MTNDETGELAAVTVAVGPYIDARPRKSCPLPSDVKERALLMIAGSSNLDIAISAGSRVEPAQQPGQLV